MQSSRLLQFCTLWNLWLWDPRFRDSFHNDTRPFTSYVQIVFCSEILVAQKKFSSEENPQQETHCFTNLLSYSETWFSLTLPTHMIRKKLIRYITSFYIENAEAARFSDSNQTGEMSRTEIPSFVFSSISVYLLAGLPPESTSTGRLFSFSHQFN